MNLHTAYHDKNAEGRSPEIEGYIDQTVMWVLDRIVPASVLDVGCDYGYAMLRFMEATGAFVMGIEPFTRHNPFALPIIPHPLEEVTGISVRFDLAFINHVLEHVENPSLALRVVREHLNPHGHVFIAVPDANEDWATWEGHNTCWTLPFLIAFMRHRGFTHVASRRVCFRETNVENWGLFRAD